MNQNRCEVCDHDEGGGDSRHLESSDEIVDSFDTIEEAEKHQKNILGFNPA